MTKKSTVAVFDFDGTITTKDTFLELIRFYKGNFLFFWGFTLHVPLLIAYKLKLYPNWKVKQKIFTYFFRGMKLHEFNRLCEDFYQHACGLIRPEAQKAIQRHKDAGDSLVVLSASIENWVCPFAEQLRIPYVICTEIETNPDNCLTGNFSTPNCYGKEKVKRLLQLFPQREDYYLIAYGDSSGDKELMNFADEKFYRRF
jgi:HAD superfamily hydrolase (TIGR01490 family)